MGRGPADDDSKVQQLLKYFTDASDNTVSDAPIKPDNPVLLAAYIEWLHRY